LLTVDIDESLFTFSIITAKATVRLWLVLVSELAMVAIGPVLIIDILRLTKTANIVKYINMKK